MSDTHFKVEMSKKLVRPKTGQNCLTFKDQESLKQAKKQGRVKFSNIQLTYNKNMVSKQ